jgi:hypothetical protein
MGTQWSVVMGNSRGGRRLVLVPGCAQWISRGCALLGEDDQDEEIRFGSGGATLDTRHAYEEED